LSSKSIFKRESDKRNIPQEWAQDRERCIEAGIPEEKMKFRTISELDVNFHQINLQTQVSQSRIKFAKIEISIWNKKH
jgi:hypothetical protein